jgi:predicted O-linked N-acetylglucosamine transferase (SPINDLY family)
MDASVPATPDPRLDRAFDLYEAGDLDSAIDLCRAILQIDDKQYGAHYLLGSILGEKRRLEEAAAALKRAIALDASRPVAHYNLANVLRWMGRQADALAAIDACLALTLENAKALMLRADCCIELDRLDEALRNAEQAVALAPADAEAHKIRGNALAKLWRLAEASASYDKAIALSPRYAEAFLNRAIVRQELGSDDRALDDWREAAALKPDYAEAHYSLGGLLQTKGRVEEALASFDRAWILKPDLDYLSGTICHARQQLWDWSEFATASDRIHQAVAAGKRAVQPFQMLSISDSNALNRQAAAIYVASGVKEIGPPPAFPRAARGDKIRVGYFSPNFRNHPMAVLMAEVFERHDRTRFEVTAFSFAPGFADTMKKRLTAAFDRFLEVGDQSDQQIAALARSLEIDVAIDLNGFNRYNRIGAFAARAAPNQARFLGYAGTSAAPFIDYFIVDRVVIPDAQRAHFSERLVRLPYTYFPYDTTLEIAAEAPDRTTLSLPQRGFVFCCFNNPYKITPSVFDGWMRILRQTPGSVLWLLRDDESAAENLRREAQAREIDPNRLVFAGRMPLAQHLERHRLADVFLDTLPYNAHTTACDALWAGVPVLTRIGESFAARGAASIVTAIGLPEMIVRSQAEYEAMAIELATNPDKLAAIKAKLANNRLTTPLFDTERFTRDLERAFEAMCERHRLGLPPEDIDLAP